MKSISHSWIYRKLFQVICQVGLLTCIITFSTACSRRYDDYPAYTPFFVKEYPNYGVGRFKTSYLAKQIDEYYRGVNPGPIGVATFVDIDDLYSTSTFGRVYAEQIMSELAMRGFDVIELRHAEALQFLAPDGEFALSRDTAVLQRSRELGGIVVGTYAVSPERVYVNARLIDPTSSLVHAAGSVEMKKTAEITKLLRGGNVRPTLERIPIRYLNRNNDLSTWNLPKTQPSQNPILAPQPLINNTYNNNEILTIPNTTSNGKLKK